MSEKIISFSIRNKLIILLFTLSVIVFGVFSLTQIPIGAVPDVTNNQVQVITTSRNLSTQDVEQFLTYPVELEMANLPGVKEIRSVSKFGLSVVTIVFEDNMGTYLPRQLIAEKIQSAMEKIPTGFGTPFMGPISTGLGEIYQYIIDTKPGYDSVYSAMDLRTIQDWVVKRQLSGIPGVVEVNTWGGFLKQYEVAINPSALRGLNISVTEVFEALEKNNNIAGGGYIEKGKEAFFIRGEGLAKSVEDIENIVIKQIDGVPVFVHDVARVHDGYATRFGAITGNGQGEKVLGQVMMLKDANSKLVIEAVKERVAEVQKTLPEGIYINPFLERSELIAKTTFTVAENLILGFLIVVFVVVLLLGNFRSGLVVASVIPLCLLFALSLMYIFGVDANLMSLGAIDFGIIIDGAVIIVEFIAFQITRRKNELEGLAREEKQDLMDKLTLQGASKMMHSAVFGQLIILLVFIPILSLSGIEGKMFKPMAMTFCFALLGAIIFCFTYVPVAASLLLRPSEKQKVTFSDKLMAFATRLYQPVILLALRHKKIVLAIAGLVFLLSVGLFMRMGGEFVPTLDEGDFVIQPVLQTGTSLSETIEITTKIEQILRDKFPEVEQVVSRIGAAEVPTDPMSMEESDVIIKLKPKNEWVSAQTKDELADKFKEALSVIPGAEYEFTQPIEMRFNELITGVRADVAVKIFGEDLSVLSRKADEIRDLIHDVEGASDISVEKIEGLPQMSVVYDRDKLARYGLNVADMNRVVSMGFAGVTAGNIFEGEKRFDLVIKLDEDFRQNIQNLRNLYVTLPDGQQIPLQEVSDIFYSKGPARISRDNTRRRIVIGINVRNRDMESVVKDVQRLIETNIQLPSGYTISYGGQFENLRSAKARLSIAVPVAMLLILIMLHFAFGSLKEALMVYSAIPLSAIGGILLLWMRDLPFSISAGVGFIALFGIAVLNGLVLIEHFKELKSHGVINIHKRIIRGTTERLRPVLLTASAAALGFFPMAISSSAGAEVQRPLATVVIGGLVSATFLTLVVLPVLYALFDSPAKPRKTRTRKSAVAAGLLGLGLLFPIFSFTQTPGPVVNLEKALQTALQNNPALKAEALKTRQSESLISTAWDIDKTGLFYNFDQNNIAENGFPIQVWGIQQTLQFPTVYSAQKRVKENLAEMQGQQYRLMELQLKKEVSQAYYQVIYAQHKLQIYTYLDSLYSDFARAAQRRYETGETNYLETVTAQAKRNQLQTFLRQTESDVDVAYQELMKLMETDVPFILSEKQLTEVLADTTALLQHPGVYYFEQNRQMAEAAWKLEKNRFLPDFQIEYFMGTNARVNSRFYQGVQVGIALPLWRDAQKARVNAASFEREIAQNNADSYTRWLSTKTRQLEAVIQKHRQAIRYYNETGKNLSVELIKTAERSFREGEIGFLLYIQSLESAREIELTYLESLNLYNQTVLELTYITR
ncbi:MAG: CusA/CzcA family heavy metal efflux RND transporter [Bacteroidia bacterium]|nr:CusA/CzcA family heavy metal efflux RND transporter [Bacteroidia bacterium]